MSKIFISHSSEDYAKALAVADWLKQNGWISPFLECQRLRMKRDRLHLHSMSQI